MAKIQSSDVPLLPPFPTEAFDITVSLEDQTIEIIKVMAKGRVAAIQTALYSMSRWPEDKIMQILSLWVKKI